MQTSILDGDRLSGLPQWGGPRGGAGWLALLAMALKNGGQNAAALRTLAPKAGDYVLEVGCGPGMALRRAAKLVGREGFVAGVDHSPSAAHFAAHAIHRALLRGRGAVLCAPADDLPFRDFYFDRAFAVNSFAFWLNPARALIEIARVLKPGGRLVLTQRGSSLDRPTNFAGAAGGMERIAHAAAALKAGGWTILDERCDKDGARLVALSILAVRPA